jgi:acetate kinase
MILVLNSGPSSLEFSLFDEGDRARLSGRIADIGGAEPLLVLVRGGEEDRQSVEAADCAEAVNRVCETLVEIYQGTQIVEAIGHRIAHGGERFVEAELITPEVEEGIEACSRLAPRHNPAHLIGIRAARAHFPDLPQVAVFDTAFHHTLPAIAYLYALPYELYEQEGIRRYGFHGISHRFAAQRAAALLERETFTGISCHLGDGVSLAAVRDGRSVDTAMGLMPLQGVAMGTCSGDVDPAVIFYLARQRGLELDQIEHLLNEESGLLGLSGVSGDMHRLEEAALQGDKRAQLALEGFTYGVRKDIGAYVAVLGRIDAVVFSGDIGENSPATRRRILRDMEGLGLELDPARNRTHVGVEGEISTFGSPVKVLVVPTNEALIIARQTREVVASSRERS